MYSKAFSLTFMEIKRKLAANGTKDLACTTVIIGFFKELVW